MDEVEAVADNHQGQHLAKLGFLEEVLDLLGVVDAVVTADALNLADLSHLGGSFDVLEDNLGVLADIDDAAQEVVEAFSGLVLLEQIDQTLGTEELSVLGGDLNHRLQVLADVVLHHGVKAIDGLLNRETAEELDEPIRVEVGRPSDVDDDSLDGRGVLVQLEGLLEQACLFAEGCNTGLVEVGEHVISKDGIRNLGRIDEIHLEEARLEMALLRLVVLESIEKEGSSLLDHALRLEDVNHPLEINQGAALMVGERCSELGALLWVHTDDMLEELNKVGLVAGLSTVGENLVELAGLSEASNDLVGHIGLQVDGECHVHIVRADHVTELLRALELVLAEPLLQQLLSVLGQYRLRELDSLVLIEGPLVEKHTKVLQDV